MEKLSKALINLVLNCELNQAFMDWFHVDPTGEAATCLGMIIEVVIETVVKARPVVITIIAGATHNDTSRCGGVFKIAKAAGVDALLHATPYYNPHFLD